MDRIPDTAPAGDAPEPGEPDAPSHEQVAERVRAESESAYNDPLGGLPIA
jgi:hypothetical protein